MVSWNPPRKTTREGGGGGGEKGERWIRLVNTKKEAHTSSYLPN